MADAHGWEYEAHPDLASARNDPDAALIMEGDHGGQIYLTCPISHLRCEAEALDALLMALEAIAWPRSEGDGASILYERRPVGSGVAGGMGGGAVIEGIWLHEEFEGLMAEANGQTVADSARAVVRGDLDRLPPPPYWKIREGRSNAEPNPSDGEGGGGISRTETGDTPLGDP